MYKNVHVNIIACIKTIIKIRNLVYYFDSRDISLQQKLHKSYTQTRISPRITIEMIDVRFVRKFDLHGILLDILFRNNNLRRTISNSYKTDTVIIILTNMFFVISPCI